MSIFSVSSQEKACEITEVISVPQNSRIFQITKEKVCILNLSWNYRPTSDTGLPHHSHIVFLGNHRCQEHDCVSISVTAEGQMGTVAPFPEFGLHVGGSTFVIGIGKGSERCLLNKHHAKVYHSWLHYNSWV